MKESDYVRVVGSVAAVIQALPADRLVEPVVVLVENSITKLASAISNPPSVSRVVSNESCHQLIFMTAG